MHFTKEKVYKSLIFAYLVIFPFGQLLRVSLQVFSKNIRLHPADLISFLIFALWIFEKTKKPKIYPLILAFALTSLFSLLFSLNMFSLNEIAIGTMYLFRLFAYTSVFLLSWDILQKDNKLKSKLFNALIAVSIAVAVFGWIQYFIYPDLRALAAYGWDDHYFRLIGTFLDPGFTSLILVFGVMALLSKYHKAQKANLIFLSAFLILSLAFTYSRAGYLALMAGLFTLLYLKGKIKVFIASVSFLALAIAILPRPGGEGVNLGRSASIFQRITNYSESLHIFRASPLFGIGFNNLCVYREKFLNSVYTDAHSCSGVDSSFLFILATTGVLGIIVSLGLLYKVIKNTKEGLYAISLLASIFAVLVHSIFHNSLFYPWVMGYLAILAALGVNSSKGKS